jgi:2-dehydro-3-deoxyphosphooctonate aldolase (KDO 8-P synthase)
MPRPIRIGDTLIGPGQPLLVMAGPCVIESRDHCLRVGEAAAAICRRLGMSYVFKASFDKANRTSVDSPRGPGLDAGLAILAAVKATLGVPVVSDIHEPSQAEAAGVVLDVIQIPAFLCRQTDLLVAAAQTGRCINVKKGQFLAPDQMKHAVEKVIASGNDNVLLTERGTFFGYGRLVVDMPGLELMREIAPVVFDATHSCQLPGGGGAVTGGQRRFAPLLSRSAVAAGVDGLFIETHDRPEQAHSDAATVWPLDQLEALLSDCRRVRDALTR